MKLNCSYCHYEWEETFENEQYYYPMNAVVICPVCEQEEVHYIEEADE